MVKSAGVLVMLALVAAPAAAQSPATAALEKQLIANERAVNEAFAKGDVKAFRALTVAEGFGVDGSGVMVVSDYEKMLATVKVSKWNIDNTRVLWLSPDVAIVAYRWTGAGTIQGQPVPSPTWASTAWVKQTDGRWLAKFHQESMAMEKPAAKK